MSVEETPAPMRRTVCDGYQFEVLWELKGWYLVFEPVWTTVSLRMLNTVWPGCLPFFQPGYVRDFRCMVVTWCNYHCIKLLLCVRPTSSSDIGNWNSLQCPESLSLSTVHVWSRSMTATSICSQFSLVFQRACEALSENWGWNSSRTLEDTPRSP
jgi:hypothetical protein